MNKKLVLPFVLTLRSVTFLLSLFAALKDTHTHATQNRVFSYLHMIFLTYLTHTGLEKSTEKAIPFSEWLPVVNIEEEPLSIKDSLLLGLIQNHPTLVRSRSVHSEMAEIVGIDGYDAFC
jgi:hypothetical protein